MRDEKKLLAKWVSSQLAKSNYVFITDFSRTTVKEVTELRRELAKESSEFHVVKNSILSIAAGERSLPIAVGAVSGQNAVVVGGDNPSGVAKILKKFHKNSNGEKFTLKGGALDCISLTCADIDALAELPPMEVLRSQFMSMLNAPAQRCVCVLNAVPHSMLSVLHAKGRE
jgi:large subunit ribosomal protein L10